MRPPKTLWMNFPAPFLKTRFDRLSSRKDFIAQISFFTFQEGVLVLDASQICWTWIIQKIFKA